MLCTHCTENRIDPLNLSLKEYTVTDLKESRARAGSRIPRFLKSAEENPDSRLAKQDYELSTTIQAHHDLFPETARKAFLLYAIGGTILTESVTNDGKCKTRIE
jgi:hypothetical protein